MPLNALKMDLFVRESEAFFGKNMMYCIGTRTPFNQSEGHEKYSAVVSSADMSSWPLIPWSNIFNDPLREKWGGPDEFRCTRHL